MVEIILRKYIKRHHCYTFRATLFDQN
uniref:Uncharacterized protein n=1 Tax=Heterorhabditis bacteriophora TaxID=37862 RepID=A0A1I7X2M4_HETBA